MGWVCVFSGVLMVVGWGCVFSGVLMVVRWGCVFSGVLMACTVWLHVLRVVFTYQQGM